MLRRHIGLATAVATALIALILYWPTLSLPLIYDTLLHIRITKELNFATVWLPTTAFGFYRPLTFLPLLIIQAIFGYYPDWLLHGLNVGQHALNAALLVALSWRLWPDGRRAFTAGLLFALFPFSYQAVTVYGHNVHPTTAGLILLGLHTYLTAIRRSSRITHHALFWWLATVAIFATSLLSHESAILFGGFAALIHWNAKPETFPRRLIPHPRSLTPWIWFLVAGLAYFVAYQFLPISRAPQVTESVGGDWLPRLLYLLQAAAYPFTWLAQFLPNVAGEGIVGVATAVTLLLILLALRRPANRLPLLLGWGWWGTAVLVIAIPLSTTYLLHGPRLLYLSSVGLALAWSALIFPNDTPDAPRSPIPDPRSLLLLAFILTANWLFVRDRLHAYAQLTEPVGVIVDGMADRPLTDHAVSINLPQWLAPPRLSYAIGAEFVAMLGDYLFVEELLEANTRQPHPIYATKLPELLANPAYSYAIHEQTPLEELPPHEGVRHIFITRYGADGPHTTHTGWWESDPAPRAAPLATFAPYRLHEATAQLCEGAVAVQLIWTTAEIPPPTTTIFVQLLDDAGQLVSQNDGPPLGLRPDLLPANIEMTDLRPLAAVGRHVLVGVYDFTSGERATAVDAADNLLPDNALRLPVQPCQD